MNLPILGGIAATGILGLLLGYSWRSLDDHGTHRHHPGLLGIHRPDARDADQTTFNGRNDDMTEYAPTTGIMEERARAEIERRKGRDDINRMMPIELVHCSAEERYLEVSHQLSDWELNFMDTMHGGLITFLLDTTMAITSRAYTGDQITPTLNLQVSFLRPVRKGSVITTRATITHVGRRVINLTAQLWTDHPDQPCATASGTFYRPDPVKG